MYLQYEFEDVERGLLCCSSREGCRVIELYPLHLAGTECLSESFSVQKRDLPPFVPSSLPPPQHHVSKTMSPNGHPRTPTPPSTTSSNVADTSRTIGALLSATANNSPVHSTGGVLEDDAEGEEDVELQERGGGEASGTTADDHQIMAILAHVSNGFVEAFAERASEDEHGRWKEGSTRSNQ